MTPVKHFFATPPLNSKRFAIRGIGLREPMRPGFVDRPAGTGDYLIMYFYDAVWIDTRRGRNRHEPGSIVIWRPRDGHYYGMSERPWRHSWIHCDGTSVARSIARVRLPLNETFRLPDAILVEKYLLNIYEETTQYVQADERIVANLFDNFMCELRRSVRGGDRTQSVPRELLELKAYIDANYQLTLSLESLAQRVHLSVPHLCSSFKRHFGSPVMAYAIAQRMRRAAYLLRNRNLRVGDVAREVGYEDLFYFSKLFKERYGACPREFRQTR